MKIVKLLEGNIIKQDNTYVSKPDIIEPIKYIPRRYELIDLGGKPSEDTRTSALRNKDYWHPIKGVKERFKSSISNKTNPLIGIENTIFPAAAGASLITAPAVVVGETIGGTVVDNMFNNGFGNWLESKTGIPSELGNWINPGSWYGASKGYNIYKNKLASKFIKGDSDLGWSPLNLNHWLFNKDSRNATNVAMATLNRVMPFLSNVEKTPARILAYNIGKRTKGNASVSLKDIKSNTSTYTGSATPDGNNGNRNLLGFYLFKNDPLINKSPWFKKISESFKPTKTKGFSYSLRYSDLYPGIENRRYQMKSVVEGGHPLKFDSINEFNSYSNGIGKIQGKEGDMVIETPMGFQTFRLPGTNYVGPIDDVGGHLVKIDYNNKGKLTLVSQDMWKFNPADYAKRWSGNTSSEAIRANKLAALMDKVGTPFILQQENPILIGKNRVWESLDKVPETVRRRRLPFIQSGLLMMRNGGSLISDGRRFKFKDSPLVRNSKALNNKRDMRKKFMKSDRPTYSNNKIKKGLLGLKFVSFIPTDYSVYDLELPETNLNMNPFNEYSLPTYNYIKEYEELDDTKKELFINDIPLQPIITIEPELKKLQESMPASKGLIEFNKYYDEVEKEDPEARYYRKFLTLMAKQESGFNSYILNRAGAPAYGYFQFMLDGKRYNNISRFAGTDIETFRRNPKLQIKAAIKLAKSFEKGFTKKDLELATLKGYTKFGLLGGAWLAGVGGVRKFLQGKGNPSDRHWSKQGYGTDVASRINLFNF